MAHHGNFRGEHPKIDRVDSEVNSRLNRPNAGIHNDLARVRQTPATRANHADEHSNRTVKRAACEGLTLRVTPPCAAVTRQEGLEPPTRSLEGCRSIQLSYWRSVREI